MTTKKISSYKTEADRKWVEDWMADIQRRNDRTYERETVITAFGETVVWSHNAGRTDLEPIVLLPGARLCALIWDLNNGLARFRDSHRLFLIDVIGQPGLSSGNSPDVKSDEMARWLVQVLDGLGLEKVTMVGASFGGELAMKLAALAPQRLERLVLMNPIGLSYISLGPRVTFFNLLPILFPSARNVDRFLDNVALAPAQELPSERRAQLHAFILQTLTRFRFKADLPYKMTDEELSGWSVPTHILLGDSDQLIQHENTMTRAQALLQDLREIRVLPGIGHGIELSHEAMEVLESILSGAAHSKAGTLAMGDAMPEATGRLTNPEC